MSCERWAGTKLGEKQGHKANLAKLATSRPALLNWYWFWQKHGFYMFLTEFSACKKPAFAKTATPANPLCVSLTRAGDAWDYVD
jgi:hypothetical protein